MVTAFVATIKSSSGDYTTLASAESGLQNDLTAATIKVFSISAATSPTIAAGDSVLGLTSAATGTCVLVNAARTQILIKSIAISTFQSGEVVQKTTDATKTVTLSNAGDSPIVQIDCYASAAPDTTQVTVDGWTTDSTHYPFINVPAGERHAGTYSTSKYRMEISDDHCILLRTPFTRLAYLQVKMTMATNSVHHKTGIYMANNFALHSGETQQAQQCIAAVVMTGRTDNTNIKGFATDDLASAGGKVFIVNCLTYGATGGGYFDSSGIRMIADCPIVAYNCTSYGNDYGYRQGSGTFTVKNCIAQANTDGYNGTFSGNNNQSDISSDVPGTSGQTGTVTFVSAGTDFHLSASDTVAKDNGADLSADATFSFSIDIDGDTRSGSWDIGVDEIASAASNIKKVLIVARASIKKFMGVSLASIKKIIGVTN